MNGRFGIAPPPVCKQEVLRYASCPAPDPATEALLDSCIAEAESVFSYQACYKVLPLRIEGDTCNFGLFCLTSKDLCKCLKGCDRAVVFGATAGVGIDRLILKHSRLSPTRGVLLQALGAERIEAFCDTLCQHLSKTLGGRATPRFSCGYGDLPLTAQKSLFAVLDCEKQIGLCLNESLMMSPTKSVTAIFGLEAK